MANRVLLLLAMASRNDPNFSSKILSETAGLCSCYLLLYCVLLVHSVTLICWSHFRSLLKEFKKSASSN